MNLVKRTLATAAAVLMSASVTAAPSVIPNAPTVAAGSYVLMDFKTGRVLAENNAYEQRAPASLTKMMTSYVLGQELNRGNVRETDMVKISNNAWAKNFPGSSVMWIEVGKEVNLMDLYRGMVVQSGNDACVAIAEHVAGTESAYTDLMNAWSGQLGMADTHFANAHGLDATDQVTTAYDMAILGRAIIRDIPQYYPLYSLKEFTFNGIRQHNRNGLLWDRSLNVDGMKTGHTNGAGYNLVSSATKGDMRLIAVVMGAKSPQSREAESKKLLNYGFRFFETVTPYKAGDEFTSQKIWYGDKSEVRLGVLEDTPVTIYRGQSDNLKANFELSEELKAPLSRGDVVGTVYFQMDGEDIAKFPLVVLDDVNEGSWFSKLIDYFKLLFLSWF
ncbi:penicillin-binding protein 6 [Ferrimonas balearica DSM 9799]|uniref:serine-type D-Ala-D-Ala carboxypeptidase n=1 Tax=Ferrimonas balearica (strain DSM 9799 / CCM 4581 / KCTC 23876 / PAT) TaxID=550540 RepID=E1SSI4_FERBD|nr:serine hydrolase [Ferrimonas balearica]MBY6018022.1 serine hydrolase [Halomonas denitrificans]ADN75024.1 penicillin-binding protein 6 [Ferrimonas balearica DSM 9799]MBW3137919.1 serine hydrolase [Ferrimonas balearica]MBW3164514.1 serine hydrolase [Ferrimonas balearica]MBY5978687.1 serine hydrolase [Ferrimonas balearica]